MDSNSCKCSKVKQNFARYKGLILQYSIFYISSQKAGLKGIPTISRVSRFAKISQFDQMYDFSAFSHQHANVMTEDMAIHIKRSSK